MDTVVTNALTDALTDVAPGAAHPATAQDADALHLHTAMAEACQQACQAIAPAWPLDRAIAVNPHWARTGIPVRQVAARMAVLGGIQVFPARAQQLGAWQAGRITPADLDQALRQLPQAQAQGTTAQQCTEALLSGAPVAQLPLLIDVLDNDPRRHTRL